MFLKYNLFTFIMAGLIMVLTLTPGHALPQEAGYFFGIDKVVHFSVFSMLTLLTIVGFSKQHAYEYLQEKPVRYSLLYTICFGVAIEFIQAVVPGRSFELYDILTNTLGVLSGCALFYLIYKL